MLAICTTPRGNGFFLSSFVLRLFHAARLPAGTSVSTKALHRRVTSSSQAVTEWHRLPRLERRCEPLHTCNVGQCRGRGLSVCTYVHGSMCKARLLGMTKCAAAAGNPATGTRTFWKSKKTQGTGHRAFSQVSFDDGVCRKRAVGCDDLRLWGLRNGHPERIGAGGRVNWSAKLPYCLVGCMMAYRAGRRSPTRTSRYTKEKDAILGVRRQVRVRVTQLGFSSARTIPRCAALSC